jgi:hypothetical protein
MGGEDFQTAHNSPEELSDFETHQLHWEIPKWKEYCGILEVRGEETSIRIEKLEEEN